MRRRLAWLHTHAGPVPPRPRSAASPHRRGLAPPLPPRPRAAAAPLRRRIRPSSREWRGRSRRRRSREWERSRPPLLPPACRRCLAPAAAAPAGHAPVRHAQGRPRGLCGCAAAAPPRLPDRRSRVASAPLLPSPPRPVVLCAGHLPGVAGEGGIEVEERGAAGSERDRGRGELV